MEKVFRVAGYEYCISETHSTGVIKTGASSPDKISFISLNSRVIVAFIELSLLLLWQPECLVG